MYLAISNTVFRISENYNPQVFLGGCKYVDINTLQLT